MPAPPGSIPKPCWKEAVQPTAGWGCLSACWAQGFSGGAGASCSSSPYKVPCMEQGRAELWPHLNPNLGSVPTPVPCCPWVAPGCGSSRHLHESPGGALGRSLPPRGGSGRLPGAGGAGTGRSGLGSFGPRTARLSPRAGARAAVPGSAGRPGVRLRPGG